MKPIGIVATIMPIILASCSSWDLDGTKARERLYEQQKEERLAYEKHQAEDLKNQLEKQKEDKAAYDASHPEVEIERMSIGSAPSAENKLGAAMNNLGFVTRNLGAQDLDNVYVKVGSYKLTVRRVQIAIRGYADECKRVSAYNNSDYKDACVSALASALNDFSSMLKNENIPDKTKTTALNEASYGNYIDFEHAARLAKMHYELCRQQGNRGYVAMVTAAAPCDGQGDVLNIAAAKKIGAL
ncbi:hypothetical protein HN186_005037 [Salmonella enterica subsp. enterica serovar Miami]|nr:hypothetical protein [Salmonella enterica subsp. enterica serovar Miami]ELM2648712.1 hypothetical protein [Salmonella enterica]